ncbi:MAG: RNA polymerase sigma-70 factor [Cyclobacteriaceae bacterium]
MEFELFFHTYYNPLFNYALVILKNEKDAEDVVQELFVDLWEKQSFLQIDSPNRYLIRAIKFKCIDRMRRDKRVDATVFSALPDNDEVSLDFQEMGDDDILPLLHFYAAKLPEKTQEIFLLSREEGLTYREIAEIKGISVKTVETQMSRALKILRKLLSDYPLLFLILLK